MAFAWLDPFFLETTFTIYWGFYPINVTIGIYFSILIKYKKHVILTSRKGKILKILYFSSLLKAYKGVFYYYAGIFTNFVRYLS